jgi:serine/threonine protein kinase
LIKNKEDLYIESSNSLYFNNINGFVNFHGITIDNHDNYYLIFDYYKEGDLRNYLINNNVNIEFKIKTLGLIATRLLQIHNRNFIHKDLHLGNILMREGEPVISDLGISSLFTKKADEIKGIVPYIAPEVFLGIYHTSSAEIYSFGMMIYEVITEYIPFHNRE